jgi:hypothetical protein
MPLITAQTMQPNESFRKPLFKRFRWVLVTAATVVLVAVISIRFLPGAGAEFQLQSIRAAGLPATLDELNRWLPRVPPSNNAALLILEAAQKRIGPSPALDDLLPTLSPGADLAEAREDFETYLQKNQETLDLVHRAAALPSARYPLNLTNIFVITYLAEVKALANLLKAEAVYHTDHGHPELAVRSVTSGFALARTLRHEPALICELVRIAMVAIALSNLEQLLAAQTFSEAQLLSISHVLATAEADASHGAFHALVSERAIILHYFNLPSSEFANVFISSAEKPSLTDKLKLSAYRLFDIRERDQRLFLEVMEQLSRAATNGYPEAFRLSELIDRDTDRRLSTGFGRFTIVSPVLHSMHKVIQKEAALITRLRCAQTALAIARYRLAHAGTFPNSLPELIPAYLPEIPCDPVEGQPLRFEELKNSFQISSPSAAAALKNPRTAVFRIPKHGYD